MTISSNDREILRDLARRVAEIGNDPVQKERAELWRTHNDLGAGRPLVLIFPENAWSEMLTGKDLVTSDTPARWWETELRQIIMKDTHTCRQKPQRMWEWVRIAREVAQESGR